MHTRVHTHMHTHTCTHARTHACTHTYLHAQIPAHTRAHTDTCTHIRAHRYLHTHAHTYMHTCTHTCVHTHTHTCTQRCLQIHAHAYVHTHIPAHTYMRTCTHAHMHIRAPTCTHTCTRAPRIWQCDARPPCSPEHAHRGPQRCGGSPTAAVSSREKAQDAERPGLSALGNNPGLCGPGTTARLRIIPPPQPLSRSERWLPAWWSGDRPPALALSKKIVSRPCIAGGLLYTG